MFKDALYVAGMILLNEKALEVKEVGKRRSKQEGFFPISSFMHHKFFFSLIHLDPIH